MKSKDLRRRLNLNVLNITEQDYFGGVFELPALACPYDDKLLIDYIALYQDIKEYRKTSRTAAGFFTYDDIWNGRFGLYQSIYFDDKEKLSFFKERFTPSDGKPMVFIEPDASQISVVNRIENLYRYYEARVISLWLILECNALVIPNLTAADSTYFSVMIQGLEDTEVAAISIKGHLKDDDELSFSLDIAKYASLHLSKLKLLIVFTTSSRREKIRKLFAAAVRETIKVIVPETRASERNLCLDERRKDK